MAAKVDVDLVIKHALRVSIRPVTVGDKPLVVKSDAKSDVLLTLRYRYLVQAKTVSEERIENNEKLSRLRREREHLKYIANENMSKRNIRICIPKNTFLSLINRLITFI
jgi:hypothetical protein